MNGTFNHILDWAVHARDRRGRPCPFPEHAYSDWTGDAGQGVCGVCYPRVIEGKGREKSADDGEGEE